MLFFAKVALLKKTSGADNPRTNLASRFAGLTSQGFEQTTKQQLLVESAVYLNFKSLSGPHCFHLPIHYFMVSWGLLVSISGVHGEKAASLSG